MIYTCTYTILKFTTIFSSFAYVTIKDRLPVILAKIADTVFRSKTWVKEDYGQVGCLVLLQLRRSNWDNLVKISLISP